MIRSRTIAAVAALSAAQLATTSRARAQVRADTLPLTAGPNPTLTIESIESTIAASVLRDVASRLHRTLVAPDTGIVLGRAIDVGTALIVVGGPVRLEGHVRGDVVALGDLVLRPGAVIDGRAIAIGGHIVNSSLAVVHGDRLAFPDVGVRTRRVAARALAVTLTTGTRGDIPTFSLPGVYGVRIPAYDRVNGLSLPFGPTISLLDDELRIDPTVTYRSQLGDVDLSLVGELATTRYLVTASARRGTFTNDGWSRNDLVNSAASLFSGSDARNYYRADRADVTVGRTFEAAGRTFAPYVGALLERSWSAARDSTAASVPWSLLSRDDGVEGMRRANPAVGGGSIASALVGARIRSFVGPLLGAAEIRAEVPVHTPLDERFVQFTLDGRIGFVTFGEQRFDAFAHGVATVGDRAPSQRFAYLGGNGTIPTIDLLRVGGDRLAWLESRYTVPVKAVRVPFVGSPTFALRHLVGGAGVERLGTLTQNVGIRVGIAAVRAEFVFDPERPSRHELLFGFGSR